ncbi:FxDxF family PEP-CTERM protein [Niveibacterium sp. SC-1]|uniref:FxDxF family PEP-CTERM protein n=1 Tax=Niveibacterium sp. SC-1 TaxID=3135646 RepID=UPI00311D5EED
MKQRLFAVLACAAMALVPALPAAASTIDLSADGAWHNFYFDEAVGSGFLDDFAFNDPQALSFNLSLSAPAWLRVADIGLAGDRFSLFANGASLGSTSVPTGSDADFTLDFEQATGSELWSHGSWLLAAGDYTITGSVLAAPFGPGSGGLSVSAVPEPGSAALLLVGCGLLAAIRRRRS